MFRKTFLEECRDFQVKISKDSLHKADEVPHYFLFRTKKNRDDSSRCINSIHLTCGDCFFEFRKPLLINFNFCVLVIDDCDPQNTVAVIFRGTFLDMSLLPSSETLHSSIFARIANSFIDVEGLPVNFGDNKGPWYLLAPWLSSVQCEFGSQRKSKMTTSSREDLLLLEGSLDLQVLRLSSESVWRRKIVVSLPLTTK
jgi:hypothetical protein